MKNKIVSFFWRNYSQLVFLMIKKPPVKRGFFKFIIYRSDAYFVHFVSVGILATFFKVNSSFCAALSKS